MANRVLILDGKEPEEGIGGVSAADFSHFSNRFLTPGVLGPTDYKVQPQSTPDMTVKYAAGEAYVLSPDGNFNIPVEDPTGENVTISPNVSGNDRIDTIVIAIDTETEPNENADNVIEVVAVQGTPASSPSALTDEEIQTELGAAFAWMKLAEVIVENGASVITDAEVSDKREEIAFALSSGAGPDGWSEAGETWTYASAGAFSVPGNQTSRYRKGTRIKLTQSGSVKYFVVTNSSFSGGTTTVTVTGGSDYTLASATITDNFLSYDSLPDGYPDWFNFTTTYTGFSANPTQINRFKVDGNTVTVVFGAGSEGTSNATHLTMTLPITPLSIPDLNYRYVGRGVDNSGVNFAMAGFLSSTNVLTCWDGNEGDSYTASGLKQWAGVVTYQI